MGKSCYPSKSWVFKSRFSFKVREHGQQQLYIQYKVCWIFYRMVCAPSLSKPYLCIQPPLYSPPRIRSTTSVNFYLPIPSVLVHKTILKIPSNTPFLYTSAIFHLPIFAYNHPNNLHQKYFPYISHLVNLGYVKGPGSQGVFWGLTRDTSDTVLVSPFFLKVWTVVTGLTTTDSNEDACYWNLKPSNLPSPIPSNYCYYFHTLLIPSQELTYPSKLVV